MEAIDNMDLFYFLRVLARMPKAREKGNGAPDREEPRRAYIDEVWPI